MPGGQFINHFGTVRYRVLGAGVFKSQLNSLDNIYTKTIPDVNLVAVSDRYPNQLINFSQNRAQVEFWTDEIDEIFILKQIIIFAKPVRTGYPQ